ncbi:MAG: hypothetical protein ACOY4Q_04110 [Bacillota bacterium]
MPENQISVTRLLVDTSKRELQESGQFLRLLRQEVQQVKAEDPNLSGYHLHNLDFDELEDGLAVTMHFTM